MKERGNFWLRFVDRYLGIPFLFILSLVKRPNKPVKDIKNVIVIKMGSIGDTLLLIPVLKAIKDVHKDIFLTVVCSKNNYEVLNRYSFIDSLKVFEISKSIKEPFYFSKFMKDVNSRKYDVLMDFELWIRISAVVAHFVKTGFKMGFRTDRQFRHLIFDAAIPQSPNRHEIENYMSLADAIGVSVSDYKIEFPISDSEKAFVEDLLEKERFGSDNLILFHPWSSGYRGHLKQWKIENFIDLAKILIEKGYWIGITGTQNNDVEAQDIVKVCPDKVVSFCGRLSLGETAYLIKKSRLLITVNTGIMHLGAALNHPMIVLHGPAGVLRWGPVGSSNVINIESDFDCAPCLNLGFEYKCKNGGCMDAIKVETVAQKVHEVVSCEIPPVAHIKS